MEICDANLFWKLKMRFATLLKRVPITTGEITPGDCF